MSALTPGLAQGCFDLLKIANVQRVTFRQIAEAFTHLGGLPAQRVLASVQRFNWIATDEDGCLELTGSGAKLLSLTSYEARLRQALLDYIDADRPSWIQNASYGRARVMAFSGSQIAQVIVEAGLADSHGDDVVAFWDALSARARGQRDRNLTEIGRAGERLTITYEARRTGRRPIWIAIDSNADGYDVLSVMDEKNLKKLTIEVKTSSLGSRGSLTLTRNEWERATESETHIFHLWDVADRSAPELARVSVEAMSIHVPSDRGWGLWEQVEVPFSSFEGLFERAVIG